MLTRGSAGLAAPPRHFVTLLPGAGRGKGGFVTAFRLAAPEEAGARDFGCHTRRFLV